MKNKKRLNWLILAGFSPIAIAPIMVASQCDNKKKSDINNDNDKDKDKNKKAEELKKLKQAAESLNAALDKQQEVINSLKEKIQWLKLWNDDYPKRIDNLKLAWSQAQPSITEAREQVDLLKEKFNKLVDEYKNIKADLSNPKLTELNNKVNSNINEAKTAIDKFESNLTGATKLFDNPDFYNYPNKGLQEAISAYDKIVSLSDTLTQQVTQLKALQNDTLAQIEQKQSQLDKLSTSVNKLAEQIQNQISVNNQLFTWYQQSYLVIPSDNTIYNLYQIANSDNSDLSSSIKKLNEEIDKLSKQHEESKDDDNKNNSGTGNDGKDNTNNPTPNPQPEPKPNPVTPGDKPINPNPQPTPQPEPNPQPEPKPNPQPEPKPNPQPTPQPEPNPQPEPKPVNPNPGTVTPDPKPSKPVDGDKDNDKNVTNTDAEATLLEAAKKANLFHLNTSTFDKFSRIVNPNATTAVNSSFNYGTVPLVRKADSEITKQDLKDMFNYIIGSNDIREYDFGSRKINTNLIAYAYSEWFYENWKYFPYYSVSNVNLKFEISSDRKYALKVYRPLFALDWQGQSTYKESFNKFIKGGLELIKPGMKDYDKAFVLWKYTSSYLEYVLKDVLTPIEKAVLIQTGVCANYAHLYSLLLNVVGVIAMPIVTGQGYIDPSYHGESHEVVYIKLQLPGNDHPMWYLSDATWAKDSRLQYQKTPIAYSPQNGVSYHEFLLPIGKSYNEPLNQSQFSNDEFFSLPWTDFFNKENDNVKYAVGPYEFKIDEENRKVLSPVFKQGYMYNYILERAAGDILDNRSAYQFYNGSFYALRSVKRTDGLYKTLVKQDLASDIPTEVDWYDVIDNSTAVSEIQASMSNGQIDRTNNLFGSYKDKFIFVGNNFISRYNNTKKVFYLVQNDNKEKFIRIEVPNGQKQYITNFYANDEGIFYSLNFDTNYHKLPMTEEQKRFYETTINKEQIKQDFITFTKLQQVDINSFPIGLLAGQISIENKTTFNNLVEYCLKNIDTIDLNLAKDLITKLAEQYKGAITKIEDLMFWGNQNTIINIPKASFDKHGIIMSPIIYQNLEQIAHPKNSIVYVSIMGSDQEEGHYTELAKNVPIMNLKITSDLIKDNAKFIKLRYYYNQNDTKYYETKPIFLNFETEDYDNQMKIYLNGTYQTSNYGNKPNWDTNDVTLQLQGFEKNNSFYELYFISKDKKITKLKLDSDTLSLGKITDQNAGLYFITRRIDMNNKSYKQYSNFFYALSAQDIYNPTTNALFSELLKLAKTL
ncbi:hypothetical protein ACNQ2T_03290 [Mycoplasma sp. Z407A]|uniref:hypothetical protein n=1 Tax=Mycoplasma sp. Z407A TaxID=3401678 RepID=UPI003AB0339D